MLKYIDRISSSVRTFGWIDWSMNSICETNDLLLEFRVYIALLIIQLTNQLIPIVASQVRNCGWTAEKDMTIPFVADNTFFNPMFKSGQIRIRLRLKALYTPTTTPDVWVIKCAKKISLTTRVNICDAWSTEASVTVYTSVDHNPCIIAYINRCRDLSQGCSHFCKKKEFSHVLHQIGGRHVVTTTRQVTATFRNSGPRGEMKNKTLNFEKSIWLKPYTYMQQVIWKTWTNKVSSTTDFPIPKEKNKHGWS